MLKKTVSTIKNLTGSNRHLIIGALIFFTLAISAHLIRSLIIELTTPDYNFHGTHHDFMAFYTAGKTVLQHNISLLYDANHISGLQHQIIPHAVGASGYMPFLNPPFMAAFLAPLALLNITYARLLWLAISIPLAVFIIYQLTKQLKYKQRLLAVSLLVFSYPMFQTFIEGQLSIIVLLGGCLSYMFLIRGKKALSGASLSLLWVLPQFGVFALLGVLIKRERIILKGWLVASIGLILFTLPITGFNVYITYLKVLASTTGNHFVVVSPTANLTWRGVLSTASGFNAFFDILIGPNRTRLVNALFGLSSAIFIGLLIYIVYKTKGRWTAEKEAWVFMASLTIACLINPHLYAQDIIILFLLLPALVTSFKKNSLRAVVIFAVTCNLALFDQYMRLHLFTIVATIFAAFCLRKSLPEKNRLKS